ncbi:unnamed protein product, partial [Cylicocyclus nassatus]
MRWFLIAASVCFYVTSGVTLADFYHLRIAARRNSRDPHSVQSSYPGFKRYPSYTIDDDGHFFIMPPKVQQNNPAQELAHKSLRDLVPKTLYFSHPKQIAPPNPDLPPPIRYEAFFINRRVYG